MPSPIDDGSPPANEDVPLNDSNEETMDTTIDQVAVEVPVPDEQPLPQQDEQPKTTDDAPMDEDPAEHIPDVEPTRASGEEELIVVSAPDETMEADVGRIQVEAIPAATEEAGITVKILDNKGKEDIMEVDEIKMVEETAGNGAENVTKTNEDAVDWNEQKKLGKAFDSALDRLQVVRQLMIILCLALLLCTPSIIICCLFHSSRESLPRYWHFVLMNTKKPKTHS